MHDKIIYYIENKEGDNFKQTEIGLIPKSWEVVRLGDVAEKLNAGGTPKTTVKEYWNGNIPFVKIGDITATQKYLKKTKTTITEDGLKNSSAWLIPENSILLSMYASIGEVAISKIPLATNQAILAIIPQKGFDVEFSFYCLKHYGKTLYSFIVQTTQKNVNKGITENLLIPLPPLPEQKKISGVLSKIQQAIEQQDKIIDATKNLKKSLMQRLFTEGVIKGFMFDTNIFNHILDNKILIDNFPENLNLFITHIQLDELEKTRDQNRRKMLLTIFKKIDQENIPTESLVLSVSKLGKAKLGDENGLYKKIKLDLDEKEIKQNNKQDALIAKTTIKNGLILVTDDNNLIKITKKYNGEVITLKDFLFRNYRKLKQTEIGLIPENWEMVRLGDIGKIITGTTPSTKKPEYYSGPYMFISPGDITERKYIVKTEKWLSEQGLKVSRPLPKDTVLVVCIGATIGKTAMTKIENCTTNQQINAILPNEDINSEYLYYSLSFFSNKLPNFAGGIGIPIINKSNFKNFKIFLPPSQVQYEIARILSTIDKKIEVEERRKNNLSELFKTMLHKLMTGEIRLKDINI